MATKLTTYRGLRTQTDVSPSGLVTTISSYNPVYSGSFTSSSVNGDRKHPNNYTMTVSKSSKMSGLSQSSALIGPASTTISGPQLGNVSALPALPSGWNSTAYNRCLSRLYSQFRGEVDLSLIVAELPENRRFIRAIGKTVRSIITTRNLLQGAWMKGWREPTKGIGSAWLAWQYAIKPSVQDIYNAANQLQKRSFSLQRVFARSHDTVQDSLNSPWSGDALVRSTKKVEASYRVQAECLFKISNSTLQACGDWSSLNPVSIAWETLPLSFVVDWCLDISSYLRNVESAMLYRNDFVGGYISTSQRMYRTESVGGGYTTASQRLSYAQTGWTVEANHTRAVLSSVPTPILPRFKVNLGPQRLISAASLLTQLLRK